MSERKKKQKSKSHVAWAVYWDSTPKCYEVFLSKQSAIEASKMAWPEGRVVPVFIFELTEDEMRRTQKRGPPA
jgi:hypothetical protein